MIIAIDFDGTFAADPSLFKAFVLSARRAGHTCLLVTGRSDEGQWGQKVREVVGDLMPIVFAGRAWKQQAATEAGYAVDVWIDDSPEYIGPQNLLLSAQKSGMVAVES